MFSGKQKLTVAHRLGDDWQDLADYVAIPPDQRQRFAAGREPQAVWEWLEARQRLAELPEALRYIGRDDLALELEPPALSRPCTPPIRWTGSPFPGLRACTPDDAPVFFGRSLETAQLLARLQHDHFVAVVGASGAGKSSLVAAGALPRLHELPGGQHWQWIRCTPGGLGDNPFLALAVRLEDRLMQQGLSARDIASTLRVRGDLASLVERYLADQPAEAVLLVFIDQFEELFTLAASEHRHRFIAMLDRAVHSPRLRLVLTLRADFYQRCLDDARLAALLRVGSFPLAVPALPALLEMITGPAALAGLTFEEGLTARLLHDTGSAPGALALLAFALSALYDTCQPGTTLTHAAYNSFGGVQHAIGQRAQSTYEALEAAAQQALGAVFTELLEVDPEQGIPTRRRAPLAHVGATPMARQLIERFVAARLLVCDDSGTGAPMVEVAHEALLTHWPRLQAWITERFDDLRLLRHVRLGAAEWQRRGGNPAYLWRHERLQPVTEMRQRLQPVLSLGEKAFLRPEADRLLAEIDEPATSHQRRARIGDRLADIGDSRPGVGVGQDGVPELVWLPVPGGVITLAGGVGTFGVAPFTISKYPVTWVQYRSFLIAADGYQQRRWWRGLAEHALTPREQYRQLDNHPAENVSWYEAVAFCRWLSARLGYEIRLPTEWEWQQAATGGHPTYVYPWGEMWQAAYANTWESRLGRTTAVGVYPQGVSLVGALDMSGNVWEWCLNEYERPTRVRMTGTARRVVRGGSWYDDDLLAHASFRYDYAPDDRYLDLGLRLVRGVPPA
jgi:hypothetical protein